MHYATNSRGNAKLVNSTIANPAINGHQRGCGFWFSSSIRLADKVMHGDFIHTAPSGKNLLSGKISLPTGVATALSDPSASRRATLRLTGAVPRSPQVEGFPCTPTSRTNFLALAPYYQMEKAKPGKVLGVTVAVALLCPGNIAQATLIVANFGDQGWFADDTRASRGTNLVGADYTHAGQPGQAMWMILRQVF